CATSPAGPGSRTPPPRTTSRTGQDCSPPSPFGKKGSAMLGDEMIDEASRKMALVIAGKGRAAGMTRTSKFEAPEG
ncbi:hypothetical protein ACFTZG_27940, partial [Streptomyces albidoflavus]